MHFSILVPAYYNSKPPYLNHIPLERKTLPPQSPDPKFLGVYAPFIPKFWIRYWYGVPALISKAERHTGSNSTKIPNCYVSSRCVA